MLIKVYAMFILNMRNTDHGTFISVCDKDLLGKTFEHEDSILDISGDFYNGKEECIENIIAELNRCFTAIIIGNNIIDKLLKKEIIQKSHIALIADQRYAMLFSM